MPARQRSAFPLERICEICERFYERDGFVKWTDVGKALGLSRQAIQLRLQAAVKKGDLPPETVERWQSMGSRAAVARERETTRLRERGQYERRIRFTPENLNWLQEEAAFREVSMVDIVNGLVTLARERKK